MRLALRPPFGEHAGERSFLAKSDNEIGMKTRAPPVRARRTRLLPEKKKKKKNSDVEFPRVCGVLSTCGESVAGRMDWNAEIEAAVPGSVPA